MADIGGLIDRLAPLVEETVRVECNLWINSKTEAEILLSNLKEIQNVLEEAEKRRLADPRIRTWLERLRDVTYEIDDALDDWEATDHQLRIHDNNWWKKINIFVHPFRSCVNYISGGRGVALHIKELNEEVDSLGKETAKYSSMLPISSDSQDVTCEITTSFSDLIEDIPLQQFYKDWLVYTLLTTGDEKPDGIEGEKSDISPDGTKGEKPDGIEGEKPDISPDGIEGEKPDISPDGIKGEKQDISPDGIEGEKPDGIEGEKPDISPDGIKGEKPDRIKVISLVGMPGIGKTTVARLAFNDGRVQNRFELKSWICASHISDMILLTKAILRSLHVSYSEDAEFQMLLELVKSSVSERTLLLVLDHMWREDDSAWNQLKASLLFSAPGSTILLTTNNADVAALMGSTETIELTQLWDDDCWSLFSKKAFHGRSKEDTEKLEGIGREIARKCEGLPHVAKILGKYLQPIVHRELWDDVLEKELWQLDEVAEVLFAPFAFNYNELPLALKHCFSYCAFYPENTQIDVDELMRLWTVQGYLSSSVIDRETELKGRDYLEKLARRYFFQYTYMDNLGEKIESCTMHPVLLNFARYLAKTESKALRLRSFYGKLEDCLLSTEQDSLKSVRVLFVTKSEQQDLLMAESNMQDLLKEIGKLIHSRYINLASNSIKQLPVTICDLYNLYCLDLRNCKQLSELPKRIHRLKKLRHLLVKGSGIRRLPRGLRKLTDLQTLDVFYVGRETSKLRYLDKLDKLRGSMCIYISDLKEEEDVKDAKKADLSRKIYLSDLRLFFRGEMSIDVWDHLKVPPNLRQFYVSGYGGTRFPSWISTSLNKLIVLEFEACAKCLELPPVGKLPFLESLRVKDMESLKHVGREFWGDTSKSDQVAFPKLRTLEFENCPSWKEWEDITENEANSSLSIMPLLEDLAFTECHKLKALPKLILQKVESLQSLIIQNCRHLNSKRYQSDSPEWESIFENPERRPIILNY